MIQKVQKIIIMGAAGRDFHNFNMYLRNRKDRKVVAFTAAQIRGIAGRRYPPVLAGKLYPKGIPIYPEEDLEKLIKKFNVDRAVLSYSDLSFDEVMRIGSRVLATGADFELLGPKHTMLKSRKPVIAVTAVRTGCGKSQTTRYICDILRKHRKKVVVIRHPMPYGILEREICERFETYKDLDKYETTIEEREEYEPLIDKGVVVYAGVDYEIILRKAEKEADVIVWDGGNNDFPFIKPDLHITIADPLRPGHEKSYYPGMVNVIMSDIVIINKESSAGKRDIETVRKNVLELNPKVKIIDADSEITTSNVSHVQNKRVVVVEDGPTLTHGGMSFGAGTIAAEKFGASMVDPRPFAVGSIKEIFKEYPHIGKVLPAMGYSREQVRELEQTLNRIPCDSVIAATPIDLRRILKTNKPIVRIFYELKEISKPGLESFIKKFI